ncbi:hypothetical protein H072_180 [Dactylellina haptotyla CBS 200.50]|uniref:Uncharacterized protein n=1 Tax=Dactylellina haptotyla (strain CBS 200.50) TaxID=1284197 RepID=S8C264_DACHA|nr:hypothetical protein H072_180 [Dactylellina haptotyla CBS 200.50]
MSEHSSKHKLFSAFGRKRNTHPKRGGIFGIFGGSRSAQSVAAHPTAMKSEEFFTPRSASASIEAEPRRSMDRPTRPATAHGHTSSTGTNRMAVIQEASHPNLLARAMADATTTTKKTSVVSSRASVERKENKSLRASCQQPGIPQPPVPKDTKVPPNAAELYCQDHKHIIQLQNIDDELRISTDPAQDQIKVKRKDIIGQSPVLDAKIAKLSYGKPLDFSGYNTFIRTRLISWLCHKEFTFSDIDTRPITNPHYDFFAVAAGLELRDLILKIKHDLAETISPTASVPFDCDQFFEVLRKLYIAYRGDPRDRDRHELTSLVGKALAHFRFMDICYTIGKLPTNHPHLALMYQTIILQKGKRDHLLAERERERSEAGSRVAQLQQLQHPGMMEDSLAKDIRTVIDDTTERSAAMRTILTAQMGSHHAGRVGGIVSGSPARHVERLPRGASRTTVTDEERKRVTMECKRVEKERERSWTKEQGVFEMPYMPDVKFDAEGKMVDSCYRFPALDPLVTFTEDIGSKITDAKDSAGKLKVKNTLEEIQDTATIVSKAALVSIGRENDPKVANTPKTAREDRKSVTGTSEAEYIGTHSHKITVEGHKNKIDDCIIIEDLGSGVRASGRQRHRTQVPWYSEYTSGPQPPGASHPPGASRGEYDKLKHQLYLADQPYTCKKYLEDLKYLFKYWSYTYYDEKEDRYLVKLTKKWVVLFSNAEIKTEMKRSFREDDTALSRMYQTIAYTLLFGKVNIRPGIADMLHSQTLGDAKYRDRRPHED